jgi:hypothetical protein
MGLLLLWLLCSGSAWAGELGDRLSTFPHWNRKPAVEAAVGDLAYPDWFLGNWQVTTTLVDLVAPLAPDVVTPGFDSNRAYLNQPIPFSVRFVSVVQKPSTRFVPTGQATSIIVSDRAYNGLSLAKAYLGDRPVLEVKVDPDNPNRQITLLRDNRQLVSTVTGRLTETPEANQFLTSELFQQEFLGAPQVYFNEVETTTAYTYHPDSDTAITADQVTAIYLSPQDPDYFKTVSLSGVQPVALYRYQMDFARI